MTDALAIDVAYTSRMLDAMLVAHPELVEDDELRADMFEGETDLAPLMSRLVRIRQERLARAEGLNTYIGDLTSRRDREARGADGIKKLMVQLMTASKLPKLILAEATISLLNGRETVSITDINALPQGTFSLERKPDKAAIKAMLDAGDDVPGAAIVHGDPSISVRVK
jgi:hypothetical protein